jgi:kynurenine formamidase
MSYEFVDLSVPLVNNPYTDPPGFSCTIEYVDHKQTLAAWEKRYPGLNIADVPDQEAFAYEKVSLTTHNGTHVDAPWHYASRTEDGAHMLSIDELPLRWFFSDGVKLDFRNFDDGYVIKASDIETELSRIGYTLKPYDIVLINTNAGTRYGEQGYVEAGCGMGREATLYLTSRGVRVAGTDAWGWDVSAKFIAEQFEKSGDVLGIWEGHKAGRVTQYSHIEKLCNLEQLPSVGFKVVCFPVKVSGGSAGWTRAVAIVDGNT